MEWICVPYMTGDNFSAFTINHTVKITLNYFQSTATDNSLSCYAHDVTKLCQKKFKGPIVYPLSDPFFDPS